MSDTKLDLTKPVATRDGHEVKIYNTEANIYHHIHGAIKYCNGYTIAMWDRDGRSHKEADRPLDLVNVIPTLEVEVWANIYQDVKGEAYLGYYPSEGRAMEGAQMRFIKPFARIKINVNVKKGEGLTDKGL